MNPTGIGPHNKETRDQLARRFRSKAEEDAFPHPIVGTPCIRWAERGLNNWGYGTFSYMGKKRLAHRMSWFLETGVMPEVLVLHRCDNPACVRFDHLFLGSAKDNTVDMIEKGRGDPGAKPGEGHHNARLRSGDVSEIKALRKIGVSYKEISQKFSISIRHAKKIVSGERWKSHATP